MINPPANLAEVSVLKQDDALQANDAVTSAMPVPVLSLSSSSDPNLGHRSSSWYLRPLSQPANVIHSDMDVSSGLSITTMMPR